MAEAARREKASETSIGKWKAEFLEAGKTALTAGRSGSTSREAQLEAEVDDLTRALGEAAVERVIAALRDAGVTIHGDREGLVPADDVDWGEEYLSLDIALKVVDGVDEAIEHIARWSSGHTEAISTRSIDVADRFCARIDAAAVMVNASTAWTDGEMFGFGAEIGISTQKLHARGPMGLTELTSTKWIAVGRGHVRP